MPETFTWCPRIDPQGSVSHRVLSAKFGDGYEQTAADGINTAMQSWPLSFVGRTEYIAPIQSFFDRHGSWMSFLWTPPLGIQGSYRTDNGYQLTPRGAGIYELAATFKQVAKP
ncbi:MAG: phage tail protein [Acidovorax sp.]|nr:phage tail protein [Acidovorax sp.]